ncbi:hypothetical protein GGS21DRAFT_87580 [Xylaria nigripes]|nr:hypothetical protein GGS21DRAFT_87580 [Xylaria nigripes]
MMSGGRIVIDGLWRCLCPSIDSVHLYKPFELWHIPRRQSTASLAHRCSSAPCPHQQRRRQYSQSTAPFDGHSRPLSVAEKTRVAYLKRLAKRTPWIPRGIFLNTESINSKLDQTPTRIIYAALKELETSEATYIPVTRLVEYLVKKRGEPPNTALYESLIRANVDRHLGSAKIAGQLFKEMQKHNIPTTPAIYEALLEVTAVHPDYVLRALALHDMKNRWYDLKPSSKISIIIGLLRDGQYENSLSQLEELNTSAPSSVPSWLLDVFLYTFGELGFHDETFAILKYRQGVVSTLSRAPLSLNAWHFLLEVFSRDAFQPGVKHIWDHAVTPGYIHPSDGVVLKVLNTASIYGNATLAMSAIQVLSTRGTRLNLHHYEPLVQVYIHQGDLPKALTVLCIMAKGGLSPDLASTRPIFPVLRDSSESTEQALHILYDLKWQYTVPAAAFNVVLEATACQQGFKVALDLYRIIRQICINGPDVETFEILLRDCTVRKHMNFLVAEMDAFSLKPSKVVLDHLIRICTMQDHYDTAFHYLDLMSTSTPPGSSQKWWMSKGSALALMRKCIEARDPRYADILKEARRRKLLDEDDIKSLKSIRDSMNAAQQQQQNPSSSSDSPIQQPQESASSSLPVVLAS